MKKNLLLRLCLIMIALLSFHACRQDLLPEKETYHNTSAFQLTNKRISLNEAKHKSKLLPELQKAEKEVEKQQLNIQGKLVDVGNGITIDTDEVIYTENEPNFHTYTFSVIRDNAPANAPVENLLMTPQADGSYKVIHIALNLTEADKAKIANKEFVDYKNKEQVTELEGINLSSLSQKQMCIPHYYSYPVSCAEGLHEPGQACAYAGMWGAAYWGGIVLYDCFGEPEYDTIMPIESPGGGGGGGGEPCADCPPETNTPQPCIQIPTDPTQPSIGMVDGNGCAIGLPTLPNIPNLADDPCVKTKRSTTAANTVLKNSNVQTKMDAVLKGKTQAPNEWAVAIGTDNGAYDVTLPNEGDPHSSTPPVSWLHNESTFFADGHSHAGKPGKPSGGDLYEMMKVLLTNTGFKYRFVYGDYFGVPESYALVVNDRDLAITFLSAYPRAENYDEQSHSIKEDSPLGIAFYTAVRHASEGRSDNTSGEYYDPNAVAMAYVLEKYNVGISIAKTDSDGNMKKINATVQQITVPGSGAVKEGVKISKCP